MELTMISEKYRFAEKTVRINSIYPQVHEHCKKYISDAEPDFEVTVTPQDITVEKRLWAEENREQVKRGKFHSDGIHEITAVYRKIAEIMPTYQTILMHGSSIAVDGQAYLFVAYSGTGKSTHTALWREYLGDRAVMVNDDKPLIRITEDEVRIYGTAYCGKYRIGNDISVPLKAICFLNRGEKNTIRKIMPEDFFADLIKAVYRPDDPKSLMLTMNLVNTLMRKTEFYELYCNMDVSAAELSYNAMKGEAER